MDAPTRPIRPRHDRPLIPQTMDERMRAIEIDLTEMQGAFSALLEVMGRASPQDEQARHVGVRFSGPLDA